MKKSILVQKFGGTSVGTPERITAVARRVLESRAHCRPVVVVSAMSGETNRLVELAAQVAPSRTGPEYDLLLASGEQAAVGLVTLALNALEPECAEGFLGFQIGMQTDTMATRARIVRVDERALKQTLARGRIPVVAGFQGVDSESRITTLGRGGSDTSAVALACVLKSECEIYTDVDGVYTTDPRLCSDAQKLESITYEEMMELASLGAKVLQIRSVELAAKYGVPLHVRSSFSSEEGTLVRAQKKGSPKKSPARPLEEVTVTGVAAESGHVKVSIADVSNGAKLARVFADLARGGVVVDVIVHDQSTRALHFTIPESDLARSREVLKGELTTVGGSFSKVSIVGVGMQHHPGVAADMFRILSDAGIEVRLITTSEIKITVLVDPKDHKNAVVALHEGFGLGRPRAKRAN